MNWYPRQAAVRTLPERCDLRFHSRCVPFGRRRGTTAEVLMAHRRCQRNHSLPHRNLLDEMINVDEVKIFKTSFRVYLLATERLNVSNPELGFVSANNWDGCAAKSAGLRTFWI